MGPPAPPAPIRRGPLALRLWRHRFYGRLIFYGTILLMLALLIRPLERLLVYPGAWLADNSEGPPSPEFVDLFAPLPTGERIHAWWLPNPKADFHIAVFHGNGVNVGYCGRSMLKMRQLLNASVLVYDYPGFGKSTGRPGEENCSQAGVAIIQRAIDDGKIDPAKLVYFGESLGGGVAVETALRFKPRALVLVRTFTSLPAAARHVYRVVPAHSLMVNRFDSIDKIGRLEMPTFIASATEDRIVPFEHGKELFAKANEPKRFVELPGFGHNDALPEWFFDELHIFLDGTVKPPATK